MTSDPYNMHKKILKNIYKYKWGWTLKIDYMTVEASAFKTFAGNRYPKLQEVLTNTLQLKDVLVEIANQKNFIAFHEKE